MNLNKLNRAVGVINLFALIFFSYVVFFQQKAVYFDSAKLLNDYKGMQAAPAAYQQKAATWKANIDALTNEVKQQIFQYEKESPKTSAKECQLSQELIRTRQNQLVQYQNALNIQSSVGTQT